MNRKWFVVLAALILAGSWVGALPPQQASAGPVPPSATTYTWNQTSSASWAVAANWTPARTTPATSDILVFNGGGSVTATNVPSQTIGQLTVSGATAVSLQAASAITLTIGGGTGTDLVVAAGASLNPNGNRALTIFLGPGATGSISGSMTCSNAAHKLNANDANAITFNAGATMIQAVGCGGNIFTKTGTANVAIFASGSTFVSQAGSTPFGLTEPDAKVVFQSGSLYRHEHSGAPGLFNRTYADFELNSASTFDVAAGTGTWTADTLTVTQGTINITTDQPMMIIIKGNVSAASGTALNLGSGSAVTVTFSGATQQTVSGDGTLTFGPNQNTNVVLNNANGLWLQRDVTFNGTLALISGDINTGAHTVTLDSATGANTSGSGDVIGNVKRSGFAAGTTYSFGNPDVALNFASLSVAAGTLPTPPSPQLPTDVTVNLVKTQPADFGSYAVNRSYTITANGGSGYSATVRLHYLDTELNGNSEANLELWRYEGAAWARLGKSGSDTTNNWVELSGVTAFSPWAIAAKTPNAVSLRTLTATPTRSAGALAILPLLGLLVAGGLVLRRRRIV